MLSRHLNLVAGPVIAILLIISCAPKGNMDDANVSDPALNSAIAEGKLVYEQYCLTCHLASGKGAPPMNPPLAGTSLVKGESGPLINIVLRGLSNTPVDGVNYKNVMPGFPFLSDEQIADVLTYIRNSFGNNAELITAQDVAKNRTTN